MSPRATSSTGFTLIELMIVVAIIGIMAAISIPIFLRFQVLARQSEAKTNLKAIFVAQKSWFAEQDFFGTLTEIGAFIESGNRYTYACVDVVPNTRGPAVAAAPGHFADATGFLATAAGNIDADPTIDVWTMDNNNSLLNPVNDVFM